MTHRAITDDLVADLAGLTFGPPVSPVYNPLINAREPWDLCCEKDGRGRREVLAPGTNPDPPGLSIADKGGRPHVR